MALKDRMTKHNGTQNSACDLKESQKQITFKAPEDKIELKKIAGNVKDKIKSVAGRLKSNKSTNRTTDEELMAASASEYDYQLEKDEVQKMRREANKTRVKKKFSKLLTILMIMAGVYILFLIFGCIMTVYEYDESGKLSPVIMSYSDIQNEETFELLLDQYYGIRAIYEELLELDYKLAMDSTAGLSLANKYSKRLERIDNIQVSTKALDVGVEYENLRDMLVSVINNMSAYAYNMSQALSKNDSQAAGDAIAYREKVYQQFMTVNANYAFMASETKGVSTDTVNDIAKWSPDEFINNSLKENTN